MKKNEFNKHLVNEILKDIFKIVEDLKTIRKEKNIKCYKTLIDVLDMKLKMLNTSSGNKNILSYFFSLDELIKHLEEEFLEVTEWNKKSYSVNDSRHYRETTIIQSKFIQILNETRYLVDGLYSYLSNLYFQKINIDSLKKGYKDIVNILILLSGAGDKNCIFVNNEHKGIGKTSACLEIAKNINYSDHLIYCENMEVANNLNKSLDTNLFVSGNQKGSNKKFIVDGISLKKFIELKFIQNLDIVTGFVYEYEGEI